MSNVTPYIGRFAPSPTGPLHFGSLVCALGSYLDAIAHRGRWLVRMENLDPPREEPGAADRIIRSLEAHGLHWHGPLEWQSHRHALYEETLDTLAGQGLLYPCQCSRAQIRKRGGHDNEGCRDTPRERLNPEQPNALRLRCAGGTESFDDIWQGQQHQQIHEDTILKRRDGLYAYQLAVVVDDIDQGVTHVVRGADLLETTGAQQRLFRLLGTEPPLFGHLPLVMGPAGQKLSKQNHAPAIDDRRPSENLCTALRFLGFRVPSELEGESTAAILHWATARWQRHQVDRRDRQLQ
ncbi:tRNA glutamyl-Q(34) synthetase GluQRS [Microbulbifer flavimaris]|uniref:Glutamyl-Q tRNA(Asp) synthetase n=1 Tax=Microbulbifer flavimaris TaxID=1781068 RepID=A0ABX4HYH0_9GAMM|nr:MULTISPECIES: tRNA glutamyl-Q(34) synthetase GluQRS [Microbulbifer]KUJ82498.1 glutamyl-Q tRNA(Asp) ligase [Microbulbifer sp. ZGT114]PCO04705.1 tRNA glutamyl-Q(34) synthetase GluQRS [Microbulbifer flavimaris]